ncbi:hypothetical protein MKZ38_001168 [Zalerion maritima]|uniref:Uncharacterized protein n=1 Tax=Zalerion maritima TaxID=339359 RepID=A0AAD5WX18_9PEZI|nr:hypothetical protein MKZ38_001168 [Zalerion maritima]
MYNIVDTRYNCEEWRSGQIAALHSLPHIANKEIESYLQAMDLEEVGEAEEAIKVGDFDLGQAIFGPNINFRYSTGQKIAAMKSGGLFPWNIIPKVLDQFWEEMWLSLEELEQAQPHESLKQRFFMLLFMRFRIKWGFGGSRKSWKVTWRGGRLKNILSTTPWTIAVKLLVLWGVFWRDVVEENEAQMGCISHSEDGDGESLQSLTVTSVSSRKRKRGAAEIPTRMTLAPAVVVSRPKVNILEDAVKVGREVGRPALSKREEGETQRLNDRIAKLEERNLEIEQEMAKKDKEIRRQNEENSKLSGRYED